MNTEFAFIDKNKFVFDEIKCCLTRHCEQILQKTAITCELCLWLKITIALYFLHSRKKREKNLLPQT